MEENATPFSDFVDVPARILELSHRVIGLAIKVHRGLGAGLPEEAYELALCIELRNAGLAFSQQHCIEIPYEGVVVARVRLDLLIEGCLVVEIKSVDSLSLVHRSQVMRYLHVLDLPLGLLLNFNVPVLKDGIRRVIRNTT